MENDFQQVLGKKILESLFFLAALGAGAYLLLKFKQRVPFSIRIFHFEYDMPPVMNLIVGIVLSGLSIWLLLVVLPEGESAQ